MKKLNKGKEIMLVREILSDIENVKLDSLLSLVEKLGCIANASYTVEFLPKFKKVFNNSYVTDLTLDEINGVIKTLKSRKSSLIEEVENMEQGQPYLTLDLFLDNERDYAIRCKTKEQAEKLVDALNANVECRIPFAPVEDDFKTNTCYSNNYHTDTVENYENDDYFIFDYEDVVL